MISDDIDMLAQMAVKGGGITRLASFVAQPLIERGLLVTLFDENHQAAGQAIPDTMQIFACVTDHTSLTPKVRVLIDYLKDALGTAKLVAPSWRLADYWHTDEWISAQLVIETVIEFRHGPEHPQTIRWRGTTSLLGSGGGV